MRSLFYILTALSVIGLAFWAYRENYETQAALDHTNKLQRSIGQSRARLAVLKAEWAYLNRPDRLRQLAEINYDRLGLMALAPEQFGKADQIAYPVQASKLAITNPVDVSSSKVLP